MQPSDSESLQNPNDSKSRKAKTSSKLSIFICFVIIPAIALGAIYLIWQRLGKAVDLNADQVAIVNTEAGDDWECYFHRNKANMKKVSTAYILVPERFEGHDAVFNRDEIISSDPELVNKVIPKLFGYAHCEYIDHKSEQAYGKHYRNIYEGGMCEGQRDGYGVLRTWEGVTEEGRWFYNRHGFTITNKSTGKEYFYDNSADDYKIDPDIVISYTFLVKDNGSIFLNKELLTPKSPSYSTIMWIKNRIDSYIAQSRKEAKPKHEKLAAFMQRMRGEK